MVREAIVELATLCCVVANDCFEPEEVIIFDARMFDVEEWICGTGGEKMAFPETMAAIQKHIRAADVLAAIGARIGKAAGHLQPNDNLSSKLDAVIEEFEPNLLDGLTEEELDALYGFVRATMRQMLHLLELPDDGSSGWSFEDPAILENQGRSSRVVTRLLTEYAAKKPEFGDTLSSGPRFLDVGCGVGWISLSMAQQWPSLRATGIDILQPALELAAKNLEQTGLSDRVNFREQNVLDLQEDEVFDVVFVPVIFLPEAILEQTFENLYRALKPSGWLFAAAFRVPDDRRMAVLNDLRTTVSGGRAWNTDELADITDKPGLVSVGDIAAGSPLHLWAARRP